MKPVEIPKLIDEPIHVLLWTVDELAPVAIGLFAGIMLDRSLLFLMAGFGLSYLYKSFRDAKSDGFALHFLYWHGVMPTKSYTSPNPFTRIFVP